MNIKQLEALAALIETAIQEAQTGNAAQARHSAVMHKLRALEDTQFADPDTPRCVLAANGKNFIDVPAEGHVFGAIHFATWQRCLAALDTLTFDEINDLQNIFN